MSSDESLGKKAASGFAKFLVALVMFIILVAITVFVLGVAVFEFINSNIATPKALITGIVLSVIYAVIVFVVPYLRKIDSVKWFAFCALGDAAWWAYLLITD
jgi:hypothetical protein